MRPRASGSDQQGPSPSRLRQATTRSTTGIGARLHVVSRRRRSAGTGARVALTLAWLAYLAAALVGLAGQALSRGRPRATPSGTGGPWRDFAVRGRRL